VSINGCADKNVCPDIALSLLRKEIQSFATVWMNLKNIVLLEISQTYKDKYHMFSFQCGI
jgi:phosphorylcholine metabolism protein LicD